MPDATTADATTADLLGRLCAEFERVELRRDSYPASPRRTQAVYFLTAARSHAADGTPGPGRAEVTLCGPCPIDLAHRALGDRERLKLCMGPCREPRPPAQFSRHAGTADGLSRDCRDCEAKRLRAFRRKEREAMARGEPSPAVLHATSQGELFIE